MRYSKTRKRKAKGTGQLVQKPTFYPLIEPRYDDVIYRPKYGERLDKLAAEYYGNPNNWWVIASFNRKPTESHAKHGDIIRIPKDLSLALQVVS